MASKNCTNPKCPQVNPQPADNFTKHRTRGLQAFCRVCVSVKNREYRESAKMLYNPATEWKGPMKLIKYTNRKLYNPATRSYVNLSALRDYVRAGVSVTVFCNTTKMDITDVVLTQAVVQRISAKGMGVEEALAALRAV